MTAPAQQLDLNRPCAVCRGPVHLYPSQPALGVGENATCWAAHDRAHRLDMLLNLLRHAGSDPISARAYIRGLHSQPLQSLLDLLRWHTDRMDPVALREWHARLRHDPRELVDPTLCPAAQLWEALCERIGHRALLLAASPILRASMGVVVHVAWVAPPWCVSAPFTPVVRVCTPLDVQPPWETATDVFRDRATLQPWEVTCPDCVDLLPMLDAIRVVQLLASVVA